MLVRAEFKRGVSLILGGTFQPMRAFSPAIHPVPYLETPDEDLEVYRFDGKRITIPTTAISHWHRDGSSMPLLPIPSTTRWEVEACFFAPSTSVFCDQIGQIDSWQKSRHYPLSSAELRGRSVWITKPRGGTVQVPFHSISTILCVPIIEHAPLPSNDWPETEHTPAQPPRRSLPRKS